MVLDKGPNSGLYVAIEPITGPGTGYSGLLHLESKYLAFGSSDPWEGLRTQL